MHEVEHKSTKLRRGCKIFDVENGERLVGSGFIKRVLDSICILQDLVSN